jgi:hypothetical protein
MVRELHLYLESRHLGGIVYRFPEVILRVRFDFFSRHDCCFGCFGRHDCSTLFGKVGDVRQLSL